jgi:plastocyanin
LRVERAGGRIAFDNVILTRKRLVKIGAAAFALLVLLMTSSACPDGTPAHQAMHGGMVLPAQTPALTDASKVTIEISGYDFAPRDLTVKAGATVTWLNRDGVPHDATGAGQSWTTGMLKQWDTGTNVFRSPGRYEYLCTIHPAMRARITVL